VKRTALARTSTLARKTPLRPRSARRAALYRTVRVPIVKRLLLAIPLCERCQQARSQDIHERLSRARGGSVIDVANLVALCRPCHDWVTTHPKDAEAEGWSVSAHGSAA
jgi:5-methylcytosine-specific restriction endonuclease McrA